MALTITYIRTERLGSLKAVFFSIVDSTGTGGTVELGGHLRHIYWATGNSITNNATISCKRSSGIDDETITLGSEATAGDTIELMVIGK